MWTPGTALAQLNWKGGAGSDASNVGPSKKSMRTTVPVLTIEIADPNTNVELLAGEVTRTGAPCCADVKDQLNTRALVSAPSEVNPIQAWPSPRLINFARSPRSSTRGVFVLSRNTCSRPGRYWIVATWTLPSIKSGRPP